MSGPVKPQAVTHYAFPSADIIVPCPLILFEIILNNNRGFFSVLCVVICMLTPGFVSMYIYIALPVSIGPMVDPRTDAQNSARGISAFTHSDQHQ